MAMTIKEAGCVLPTWGDARCVVVTGAPQTGKTELLVARVAELAASGIGPEDILVFAASRTAAQDLRSRIAGAVGSDAFSGRVTTALDHALAILAEPSVSSAVGRPARMMSASEEALLMEDMKMVEGKPSRNREIIKFLLRGWTEVQDEEERFIISSEEYLLNEGLKERLIARCGMLPHEVAASVVKCLRRDCGLAKAHAVRYVFVDDCQSQCKASQLMADLLCDGQLALVGNPDLSCETLDPYPYPEGMNEIGASHSDSLELIELERSAAASAPVAATASFMELSDSLKEAHVAKLGEASPCGEATWTRYLTAVDEAAGVSREIASLSCDRRVRTGIIVPSATWGARMELALKKRGVSGEFRTLGLRARWSRDLKPSALELAIAIARIALDSHDGPAWRTVFGCRCPLLGCGEWRELEEFAGAHGESAVDSLFKMTAEVEGMHHARHIVECRDWALSCVSQVARLEGDSLTACLVELTGVSERRLPSISEGAGCEEFLEGIPSRTLSRGYSDGVEVRIGTPETMAGLALDEVFITGALDGLYPSTRALDPEDTVDHRAYYRARDERAFCSALSRAREILRVSAPFRSELDKARKQSMGIKRIFAKGGVRWADLALSQFVPYAALEKYDPSKGEMEENDD